MSTITDMKAYMKEYRKNLKEDLAAMEKKRTYDRLRAQSKSELYAFFKDLCEKDEWNQLPEDFRVGVETCLRKY